jgi:hypothetical protein
MFGLKVLARRATCTTHAVLTLSSYCARSALPDGGFPAEHRVGEPDRDPAQHSGAVSGAGVVGDGCRPADTASRVVQGSPVLSPG